MAKNSVRDFSSTAASNTDIQSVNIDENCAASGINNAIREVMADLKDVSVGTVALESPKFDSILDGNIKATDASGTDTAGTATTIKGGAGTGTGAGGSIVFQVADGAGSTGSSVNAHATAMTITDDGNLLVGSTNELPADNSVEGMTYKNGLSLQVFRDAGAPVVFGRGTSDGSIVKFSKDGTVVGSIGSRIGDIFINTGNTGLRFYDVNSQIIPVNSTGLNRDNAIDLGNSVVRFDDIFATNGTIQTSDQNEKQQIASLTDAEITAAKAISKLFKTFKWKDKVAAKGDAARTHTGVIAQDVEAAMTDAGLDAGDYAFFISTDWHVDADGNEVEADAEGAIAKNRKGIRYPELLAFVGAATEQRLADVEARITALETA